MKAPELSDYLTDPALGGAVTLDPAPPSEGTWYVIDGVAATTLCVGPNNAGKSRFLRALAKAEALQIVRVNDPEGLRTQWEAALGTAEGEAKDNAAIQGGTRTRMLDAIAALRTAGAALPGPFSARQAALSNLPELQLFVKVNPVPKGSAPSAAQKTRVKSESFAKTTFDRLRASIEPLIASVTGTTGAPPRRVYVPTLRSMRRLDPSADVIDRYLRRTYGFPGKAEKSPPVDLFTGHAMYEALKRLALDGAAGKAGLDEFEKFMGDACFSGRRVLVRPKGDGDAGFVEITVGGDQARSLDELGDGIAHAILVSFPIFYDPDGIFLIEEPETHLHPGLQRELLRAYGKYPQAMILASTHSNHLLDMAAEEIGSCALMRFRKEGQGGMEGTRIHASMVPFGDLSVLADLGVTLSSVARVNAVIWVEGVTDRLFLRWLLELIQPSDARLVEHLHYGFVEYGGAAVAHLSFEEAGDDTRVRAVRIGGKAVLVADRDGDGKTWRDSRLSAELGDRFMLTPGRELENLLPPAVLRAVLMAYKEERPVVDALIVKSSDYRDEKLGEWLDKGLGANKKRKGAYGDESGTVADKSGFWAHALHALSGVESKDLEQDVREWATRLHAHLQQINATGGMK